MKPRKTVRQRRARKGWRPVTALTFAAARRFCRTPRLVNIHTVAFRRVTNLCGTAWELGTASQRRRTLCPRRPLGRGYLVRIIPRAVRAAALGAALELHRSLEQ